MIDKIEFFVGVYGFMQLSMMDVGLLDDRGVVKKTKGLSPTEQDGVAIYRWVSDQIRHVPAEKLKPLAAKTDARVRKLLNEHTKVNNYLLSVLLLRAYVDDADKATQILVGSKINRVIESLDAAVTSEEFDALIRRTTARTADNIYRQFIGRPQLSDEVREARFKRIKGKI